MNKEDALNKLILTNSESKYYKLGKSRIIKDIIESLNLLEEQYRDDAFQKINILNDIKKQIKHNALRELDEVKDEN